MSTLVVEPTGETMLIDTGHFTDAGRTYTFPDGYALGAGETVTLHTGSGTDSDTDLYWDSASPVWNNGGDTVTVRNSDGDIVHQETYE